jgi:ABC-2 type transport system permease protein
MSTTTYQCYLKVMRREILRIATKPMYLFCMVIAPLFCFLFFTTLMENGLPTNLPAGVVDLDNTATTRNIIRNLDAFQQTQIVAHYPSVTEARQAVQRGEIYSFYYILYQKPNNTFSNKFPLKTDFPPWYAVWKSVRKKDMSG